VTVIRVLELVPDFKASLKSSFVTIILVKGWRWSLFKKLRCSYKTLSYCWVTKTMLQIFVDFALLAPTFLLDLYLMAGYYAVGH
jgi:hypothetical protein